MGAPRSEKKNYIEAKILLQTFLSSPQIYGNLIYCQNVDSVGLSLHSLRRAVVDVNLVESTSEMPRQMALGQGIVISDSLVVHLSSTEVVGMRVGFQLSNSHPEHNEVIVRDCSAKQCSLGKKKIE